MQHFFASIFAGLALQTATSISPPATNVVEENVEAVSQVEAAEIDENAVIENINAALNDTETARGRFLQISADGYASQGEFALRRPGRMRFDYDDPDPLTIVADGTTVAIADRALETVDRVPLSATPLGLILKRDTDLAEDAEIIEMRKSAGFVSVQLRDKTGEAEGDLTLFFDENDFSLVRWVVVDPQGAVTQVRLSDIESNVRLNGSLFRLDDLEDDDDRRR